MPRYPRADVRNVRLTCSGVMFPSAIYPEEAAFTGAGCHTHPDRITPRARQRCGPDPQNHHRERSRLKGRAYFDHWSTLAAVISSMPVSILDGSCDTLAILLSLVIFSSRVCAWYSKATASKVMRADFCATEA